MHQSWEGLEDALKVLANRNRLRLLRALRMPRTISEIRLPPGRSGERERPISRQGVRDHIVKLRDAGLVRELPAERAGAIRYVADHRRLYNTLERLRAVAISNPYSSLSHVTRTLDGGPSGPQVAGPHFVLARGVGEGRAFPLVARQDGQPWLIGAHKDADVCLDYDIHVSANHAFVANVDEGYVVRDLPANKNGTFLNWERLGRGMIAPLAAGDVIGAGSSLLVFRPASASERGPP